MHKLSCDLGVEVYLFVAFMYLLGISFFAGVLSVLAPCVLPVLPVILGGTLGSKQRRRPLVIIFSTGICITLFTLLLKVSTALLHIPQHVRTRISAGIIILYGLTLVGPSSRERLQHLLGLHKATNLLDKASGHEGIRGDILLGASLGPIFASCSPTYAILLSTIFPQSIVLGTLYTLVYALGFCLLLTLIAYGGRAVIRKLRRAADPTGWFKRLLGLLLISTGLLIGTGVIKKLEVGLLDSGFFDVTKIEQQFLERSRDLP